MGDTVTRNRSCGNSVSDGDVRAAVVRSSASGMSGAGGPHSIVRFSVTPSFPMDVLAVGGELKNTACFGHKEHAWVTGTNGALIDPFHYRSFAESIAALSSRHRHHPYVVAHDLHPSYVSTSLARSLGQPTVAVQHHHAHAVSCALDAGVELPVIGIVCDGTGFGTDGASWGGEVLLCHAATFQRLAHLDYFAIPGGDVAARSIWRSALSVVSEALPELDDPYSLAPFDSIDAQELRLVNRQLETRFNTPSSSSLGRLFDAVAFLTGVCARNEHEGQAAMGLESAARPGQHGAYRSEMNLSAEVATLDWRPMIREIIRDVRAGVGAAIVSARFHETLMHLFAGAAVWAAEQTGVRQIVLSGGCFLNTRLREGIRATLSAKGLPVAIHERLSPGDAGLSLGQAFVGSSIAAERKAVVGRRRAGFK